MLSKCQLHLRRALPNNLFFLFQLSFEPEFLTQVPCSATDSLCVDLTGCSCGLLLLLDLGLEPVFAEADEVLGVLTNHLLAEVLQDAGELWRNDDLVGAEDAHLTNVSHFCEVLIDVSGELLVQANLN